MKKTVKKLVMEYRSKLRLLFLLIGATVLFSCERELTVDIPPPPDKIVVGGTINEGSGARVTLTKNQPFYGEISIASAEDFFIAGATVRVSDGEQSITLQEFAIDTAGVEVVIYVDLFSQLAGERGKTYSLEIEYEEQLYTATTQIPNILPMDSIWAETVTIGDNDSLARVSVQFNDADTLGNYYRYFTQRNSEPMYPGLNSVFDDLVINGETFPAIIDRGYDRNSDIDFEYFGYFNRGDTVVVRNCGIDEEHFRFWQTMEAAGNGGGPFSPITIVKSNIVGENVLGIWGGYSIDEQSIIIPEDL
ncbi:DUF4249 domain-containing protein [Chitinophagales bacterium]|nr:DUF4249 domain-containing protein [Chitinophagales bacterium]